MLLSTTLMTSLSASRPLDLRKVGSHDLSTTKLSPMIQFLTIAIILATLAMKRKWQAARKAAGKSHYNPNIVMNSAVQVCTYLYLLSIMSAFFAKCFSGLGWEKAARYLDIEEKYVYCTKDRYVIDPKQVRYAR